MNLSGSANSTWAVVIILVVPALIIAAAELDERLRQRRSPLRTAVVTLRNWGLPLFAIWALLVPVGGAEKDSFVVRLVSSALLLAISVAVLSVLRVIIDGVRSRPLREGRRHVPQLLLALPRLAVIISTGWILIDTVWGVDLSSALTALGVTSLVISFALQDTLSGLASGMLLLSDQPFQPGDWIKVGDIEGNVVDINWRTSRIRTRNGDMIIVPNSELAGSSIVNFTSPASPHRVVVSVQVAYLNPPTLAKQMLLDAAAGTPGVRLDPPPNVAVTQIDDPMMGYEVHMWVDDYAIAPRVKSDFGALVWYQSNRHGVPLPSPAQDLYLYDGVDAGEAGTPTLADIRQGLQRSPLLGSLSDADLDRLARSASPARFAVGELLFDTASPDRDLVVIVEGRAQLIALADDEENVIAELGVGEIVGLLGATAGRDGQLVARAVTDCEVMIVDPDVTGEIGSRNANVATALNQTSAIRMRRLDRILERRLPTANDADQDTVS
jgi:small-conductance mechanosensitive channel